MCWLEKELAKAKYVEAVMAEEYDEFGVWDWRQEDPEDEVVDKATWHDSGFESLEDEHEVVDEVEESMVGRGEFAKGATFHMALDEREGTLTVLGDKTRPRQKRMGKWLVKMVVDVPTARPNRRRRRGRRHDKKTLNKTVVEAVTVAPAESIEAPAEAPAPAVVPKKTWSVLKKCTPMDLNLPEDYEIVVEKTRPLHHDRPQKWCSNTRADAPCEKMHCYANHDLTGILEGTSTCHFAEKCRRVGWSAKDERLVNTNRKNQNPCRFTHPRETETSFKLRCFPRLFAEECSKRPLTVVGRDRHITLVSAAPYETTEVDFAAQMQFGKGKYRILMRLC